MAFIIFSLAASLIPFVSAQQIGTYTPEVHPMLTSQQCTKAGGCVTVNTSVVLDASFRSLHNIGGNASCVSQGFNTSICPDAESCSRDCALEGVDYASYGIKTNGTALTLNLFTTEDNVTSLVSPRVYLLANDTTYDMFQLLDREITFDVDISKAGCGVNGALYLSEMSPTGNEGPLNSAGAKYGTGYCDAQCPSQNYINGVANFNGTLGACCAEMDLWEANSAATAFTPHPCNTTGVYACTEPLCGHADKYAGVCDEDGCDFNAYRNGAPDFYGPNKTIDTNRKFTVVTQFLTTRNKTLTEIKRLYVQDGKVIQNAHTNISGVVSENSISDAYCKEQKTAFGATDDFSSQGGLAQMGRALDRGMVLIFSIWDDAGSGMQWLDGTSETVTGVGSVRGPCSATSGDAAAIMAEEPGSAVTFENIRTGEIGSTFLGGYANAGLGARERVVGRHV
ncbi:Endo-beta-1,4-glucanase [Lachnellula occidentalis]|uniref:Glucanase n=1 Tax=Lachnellula occidentalis TaxID=215460 RepID=A0A8H8RED7_9HELO|nr:Endo-beta-1,4-glucanase [Lachnellula occidentalis]